MKYPRHIFVLEYLARRKWLISVDAPAYKNRQIAELRAGEMSKERGAKYRVIEFIEAAPMITEQQIAEVLAAHALHVSNDQSALCACQELISGCTGVETPIAAHRAHVAQELFAAMQKGAENVTNG